MLRKGIAVICRTQEEYDALCKVANNEGYRFCNGDKLNNGHNYIPIRISFNIYHEDKCCCTRCEEMNYPLNAGIKEVYEASKFLHNVIISERIKQKE